MTIRLKTKPQEGIITNDVVFSTVQIEKSQFVTLPASVQNGPRFKAQELDVRNLCPPPRCEPTVDK
jgi:hypothetical protein